MSSSRRDTLLDWTATRIQALYGPPPPAHEHATADATAQLTATIDAAFHPDAEFILNHKRVDRAAFTASIGSGRSTMSHSEVHCNPEDLIEAHVEDGNLDAGSIVAGKATVVHTHPWRIRASPAKTLTVVVFSAKIQATSGGEPKIVQLFQTTASKPFPIVMPKPHAVDATAL